MSENWPDLSELLEDDDEPTARRHVEVPRAAMREAMRPPRMPSEAVPAPEPREPSAMHVPQVHGAFVYEYRILEQLVEIRGRVKRVERGLLILGAAVVLAQKLDVAKLLEIAKALAAIP